MVTPIVVDPSSHAKNRWDIYMHKGGMQTAGVGGAITGKGAKILIIDDPVKNSEQAFSTVYREKAKEWYKSTAFTRLEPDGAVIIIQTRWHEDDLSGWLLNDSNEEWTIRDMPAISEEGKALRQKQKDAFKNITNDSENKKEDEEVKIVPMSNTFCFAKKPIKNRLKYKPKFDYMNTNHPDYKGDDLFGLDDDDKTQIG
jgi:hypothetical protein